MDEKEWREIQRSRENKTPKKLVETSKEIMNRIISDEIPKEANTKDKDQDSIYKS